MSYQDKDPMILFRSTIRGKNSKGGDRTQLYLTQEAALTLIEEMQKNLENPKGVKLDLHTNKKEFEGRTFDSSFAFVKPVSEGPAKFGNGAGRATAKPKTTEEEMQKKIAALKATVATAAKIAS